MTLQPPDVCVYMLRHGETAWSRSGWSVYRDGAPAGETPGDVSDRADHLIAHLDKLHGNVAIFTHGQIATVLGTRWVGLPVIDAQHFSLGPHP